MLRWAVRLDTIEAGVGPDAAVGPATDAGAPTATAAAVAPRPSAMARQRADLVARLGSAAAQADYRVDRLLALLTPAPVPTVKRTPRATGR